MIIRADQAIVTQKEPQPLRSERSVFRTCCLFQLFQQNTSTKMRLRPVPHRGSGGSTTLARPKCLLVLLALVHDRSCISSQVAAERIEEPRSPSTTTSRDEIKNSNNFYAQLLNSVMQKSDAEIQKLPQSPRWINWYESVRAPDYELQKHRLLVVLAIQISSA